MTHAAKAGLAEARKNLAKAKAAARDSLVRLWRPYLLPV
jgi:hypothetical protein